MKKKRLVVKIEQRRKLMLNSHMSEAPAGKYSELHSLGKKREGEMPQGSSNNLRNRTIRGKRRNPATYRKTKVTNVNVRVDLEVNGRNCF